MAFFGEPPQNIIAVASGKGGVGKSTVATNLAVALRKKGRNVGLMDADIYGPSQPGMLGAQGEEPIATPSGQLVPVERYGIKFVSMGLLMGKDAPLIWRAPMAMKVIQQFISSVQWGSLDDLIIDLPPGTGDVQLTLAQQASLSGAVIVSTPQEVSLEIAKKGLKMFDQVNVPIVGIVENMSGYTCGHCGKTNEVFKTGGAERLARELKVPFLGKIPLDSEVMKSGDAGTPIVTTRPDSEGAKAFLSLAESVIGQVEELRGFHPEPKSVDLTEKGDLKIHWPDGSEQDIRPYDLRVECACAYCVDENTGKRTLDPRQVKLDVGIKGYTQVGRYALGLTFSDGHNTGIYAFDRLKKMKAPEQGAFHV